MSAYESKRCGGGSAARGRPVLFALLLAVLAAGCDFLDPTEVENPRTTDEDLATAEEPVRALLPGLRAQFARALGSKVVVSEVVSDNYSVQGTGIPRQWDNPRGIRADILNQTSATLGKYWNSQELRALADFILDDIAPVDDAATNRQLAEAHFYRGMAYLFQGANFTHVPTEADGTPRPAEELLARALDDLQQSLTLAADEDFSVAARGGIARAHRLLGDGPAAIQAAQDALAGGAEFFYGQIYDSSNLPNAPNNFLVQRALKEMQPLPRLDFLDPKYVSRESEIPVSKAEEMHLIMAEATLAGGDVSTAQEHLADAIELARTRPVEFWVDDDPRFNDDLSPRPRSSDILVRADPDSPFRAGLVLDRPDVEIPVPYISATSLDADSIRGLTDETEVWHSLHLARQEILIVEGQRMSDLGIRLPMMEREIDTNPNVSSGDPGTEVVVPDYIPTGERMNQFDPQSPAEGETEVTIRYDMNRILTQNQVSPFLN